MNQSATAAATGATERAWSITPLPGNLFEVTFSPGVSLGAEDTARLVRSLQHHSGSHPARVLINVSGLSNVCPDVAGMLSTRSRPTRLAFLGESLMDEVLAGFTLPELDEALQPRYFTERGAALEYLDQR